MSFSKIQGIVWKLKTFLYKQWITFQDRFGLYDYADWIRENELRPADLEDQKGISLDFPQRPLISCILVFNQGDFENIKCTFASLSAQTYDNWEACCIVSQGEIDDRLRQLIITEPRLRLLDRKFEEDFFIKGKMFTAKTFQKMLGESEYIGGEFLFVLRTGDTVAPDLLFRTVERLNHTPDIDLFYTDEDYLSRDSRARHSPFFKPDWSPELLCSTNYLKFAIIRKNHLQTICAQSEPEIPYDELILRGAEEALNITHLAEVLIHFLDGQESGSSEEEVNGHFAFIKQHIEKMGISEVEFDTTANGTLHLKWQFPQPLVSIIIPTKDRLLYLQRAVESIRELTSYTHYKLVIVDNDSNDPATLQYYEQLTPSPDIRILKYPGSFNFSKALNLGARESQGEIFLFLNNDIQIIDPEWLTELVRWAMLPGVGIVGARLLYPHGEIQHAGIVVGMEGHASHVFNHMAEKSDGIFGSTDWYRNYSAVTGACMAMRRQVYDEIGGFDEDYQLVFSDVAICLQALQHGYRVVYNPFARLIHHEGRSRSNYIPSKDIAIGYNQFWDTVSKGDPCYNPNLSYAVRQPTFRRQGEETPGERLLHILEYSGKSPPTKK